jgi:ABC-2 type transport system ATP-binding protein
MGEAAIRTAQLGKTYDGAVYAVHDLSVEVPEGEVFGFLGPNGAGKTTTVKLLTGLLKPTEGSCSVMGLSPSQKSCEVHRLCGVLTDSARMYGQMTGTENLLFFAQVSGMNAEAGRERAEELLKRLDLWDARDRKLRAYSTGMTQRLSLARALVNRPKVLFLDEPTSGLDPESAQSVNGIIASLARTEGVTVFLCTHQLRYAQDICERYGIIEKGALLACGDLDALSRNAGIHIRAALRLREGDAPAGFERGDDGWWYADVLQENEMPQLLKRVISSGNDIFEARLVRPTLEDVYFKYVRLGEAVEP